MKPLSLGECCSQEQLMSLLDGQLGQHDSDLALSHIEQCDGCRKSLEDLSGDVRDWKEAREILSSSTEFGLKPSDDWSQSLSKRLLSPSSHPEMLGRIGRYDIESMLGAGGMMPGTPPYMSPEQSRGEKLTERSDVFSAGSVLYAMCTGRAPFRAESPWKVLKLVEETEPKPIRELNEKIPQWLSGIIETMMANVLGAFVLNPSPQGAFSRSGTSVPGPVSQPVGQPVSPPQVWRHVEQLPPPPEERLLQRLSEPVNVDLQNVPLSEALAEVLGEIPYELESNPSESNPSEMSPRVFASGRGSRSGMLRRILTEQELGYIVHPNRIEIASRESVDARPVVRSYCLSYVTANDQQASQLVDALRRMFDSSDQQTPEMTLNGPVLMVRGTERVHEQLIGFLAAWNDRFRR
jgi:serine/threonine protein kinase